MKSKLIRVTRANPCPICEKDTWCMYNEESALCMRAASSRPINLKSGETGYWHDLNGKRVKYVAPKKENAPQIDAEPMALNWRDRTKPVDLLDLADDLGVKPHSLVALNVGWASEHRAWSFPMRDSGGKICGIRLRAQDGKKWSVPGSKSGIFLPWCSAGRTMWIVEGATDLAAILSMGLFGVGRPSCSGGTDEINAAIRRLHIQRAVIISDNDQDKVMTTGQVYNPGADGAKRLSERLVVPNCVITLPVKDAREYLAFGGTAQMLENMTKEQLWQNSSVRTADS